MARIPTDRAFRLARLTLFGLLFWLSVCLLFLPGENQIAQAQATNPVATKNLQRQARQFLSIVRSTRQISDDLQINHYVVQLAKKLFIGADLSTESLHYYVIDDPVVNAFAGPGATFFLNSGLIELARNEAELVAVMAHEIAHFTQDHLDRLLRAYKATQTPSILAVLAGILIGGDAGIAAIVGSQAARTESLIDNTLRYEREADNVAVRIMVASDYDPRYAKDFMLALEREIRERGIVQTNIHNTHPVTPERIASIDARLRQFNNRSFPQLSPEYLYFKARNRVSFHWQSNKTYQLFESRLTTSSGHEQLANRYGYALALAKDGNSVEARNQLTELLALEPDNLWFILALAQLEIDENNPNASMALLKPWAEKELPHPAVIELFVNAMLLTGNAEQAHRYLRKHLASNREHIQLLKLNVKTATQSGAIGDAYLADADYHFLIGDLKIALNQLKHAELNSDDFYTVAIAREKMKRISEELAWREN